MLRISLLLIIVFSGCCSTEIRIQGQYAATRIFAKEGEIGIAFRPNVVIMRE